MTDETGNLILEHLRQLRANDEKVMARLDDLVMQYQVSNAHISALVQHENYAVGKFAELEARLQRIEHRLELRDER
jgi:hypothetical protein